MHRTVDETHAAKVDAFAADIAQSRAFETAALRITSLKLGVVEVRFDPWKAAERDVFEVGLFELEFLKRTLLKAGRGKGGFVEASASKKGLDEGAADDSSALKRNIRERALLERTLQELGFIGLA